jgi:CubicO group peptidase (beta-lactamase class C family)
MGQPEWWGKVVERMKAYQAARPGNLPGAVFGVETPRTGKLISSVGDGWNEDTICSIGSMTKPFVATGVLMALEERGLLDVEKPVFELPGMGMYSRDEMKRRIRVRHLLQHTSGLPSAQPITSDPVSCTDRRRSSASLDLGPTVPWVGDPGGTNEYIEVGGRMVPARAASLDEVSRHVMQSFSPIHEPGAEFTYSTLNYLVAGRIIEEVTGESMNRYLRRRLFEPLGMRDSFFVAGESGDEEVDSRISEGVSQQQRERIAEVTVITQDGRLPQEIAPGPDGRWDRLKRGWRFVYADGGMYSTAEDLLKYLGMLRDGGESEGGRVVSEEIVRLLVEDQGFGHTMGFGYRSDTSPYGQAAGTLEHLGNLMTYMWYEPSSDYPLLGVFLSQRLPNVAVMTNMVEGLRIIYSGFILLVESGVRGFQLSRPA